MLGPFRTGFGLSFTFAMSALGIWTSFVDQTGGQSRLVARAWAVNLCRGCGVSITVEGGRDVDWSRPFIVMANHQSLLDTPALLASLPRVFGLLAKKELFRIPVFASGMRAIGCVPIDRGNHRQSLESMRAAAARVQAGNPIAIYPEGTRSPDGRIGDLKKGAFYLADMAGVPVIPVGIRGTRNALPADGVFVHPARVRVAIGTPIVQHERGRASREKLRTAVRAALIALTGYEAREEEPGVACSLGSVPGQGETTSGVLS